MCLSRNRYLKRPVCLAEVACPLPRELSQTSMRGRDACKVALEAPISAAAICLARVELHLRALRRAAVATPWGDPYKFSKTNGVIDYRAWGRS